MRITLLFGIVIMMVGCGPSDDTAVEEKQKSAVVAAIPYASTYEPYSSVPTLITGATIFVGDGREIANGHLLAVDGRISYVGADTPTDLPDGTITIDAAGKYLTPGLIDIHSHLGVYPSPNTDSTQDGNEIGDPNAAEVWAEHSVWPQDPGFSRALAGGVTALQILPGSANLFGGRTVTLKNVSARTVQDMKFPGAPYGFKMACGENPKRVYKDQGLNTRMGNFAGYRTAFIEAEGYKKKWEDHLAESNHQNGDAAEEGEAKEPPDRNLQLESLAGVLSGDILLNVHCYRADEMAHIIDLAKEFGFKITSFHHAVEAYKIADLLAQNAICAAIWADWWGFKLEAYDSIRENAALVAAQDGGCAIVHSDSEIGIQRLNQEAAKAMADGQRMGLDISPGQAMSWITLNPAKAMGIAAETGSLETGKMADLVIWDHNPLSVYAKAEKVFVDGALLYDRTRPDRRPVSDFELGQDLAAQEETGQ